jgi:hypothetical protein
VRAMGRKRMIREMRCRVQSEERRGTRNEAISKYEEIISKLVVTPSSYLHIPVSVHDGCRC